jgi:hypothetical protein
VVQLRNSGSPYLPPHLFHSPLDITPNRPYVLFNESCLSSRKDRPALPTQPTDRQPSKYFHRQSWRDPLDHIVLLDKVAAEPVRWLSPGRLAAGKLTLLDGDPGLGKSTLLCEFAARLTRGQPLPGGPPDAPRVVLLLSAEDDLHDTIRPRLDAAGGDPTRVISLVSVPDGRSHDRTVVIPGDVPILEDTVRHTGAALLIVDPLMAYLHRRHNANSDQDVRRALVALKILGERTGVAIVVVRHLNKTASANPLYRGGGSIGIIGAARCGLLLAADPDDPARRILAVSKANLAVAVPSLAFRLLPVPGTDVARIAWDGDSPHTAADLLRPVTNGERTTALNAVRAWLRDRLADGPRPAAEMLAAAEASGISEIALKRARRVEGIIARKARGKHGNWIWSLPVQNGKGDHPTPS